MSWKPVAGNIMTRWANDVSPDHVWQQYPRPQMVRPRWANLNGLWDYWITPRDDPRQRTDSGRILVPFPIESALSGVMRRLQPEELLWYQKSFSVPPEWQDMRVLLHFEAVDWQTTVTLNGCELGTHQGGYLPFSFDITDHLANGENQLIVSVWDPGNAHWQQRGKQASISQTTHYTAASGIWQTVWLECVPSTYIARLKITPDIDAGLVHVQVQPGGQNDAALPLVMRVKEAGVVIAEQETDGNTDEVALPIPDPKLWSPDSPFLYDLEVSLGEDRVESYFGMRKFSLENQRLCLNGSPLFQYGPLDQGYWPDGIYTPPSEEAMRFDVELTKRLGFNMIRKHVKVEPRRFYYDCDRIGLIVWQDMPHGGKIVSEFESSLVILFGSLRRDNNYRYAGREEEASRQNYRNELKEMVDHLYNHACIGMWVPFNEGWGQFDARQISTWLKQYDPTRMVDEASGWYDQGGGDCVSRHRYVLKLAPIHPQGQRAAVLSEFGGYALRVEGHMWNYDKQFGYKNVQNPQELTSAYLELLERQLKPLKRSRLSAAVYTQTTDVEGEINGFVTYDREVEKMDFASLQRAHRELIEYFGDEGTV